MTDKELKKKIVEVVNQWHMFQNKDMNGHTIWLTNDSEKLADALIEAGIGDVETLRKIGAHATAMAVLRAAKAEHRAEVAERALKLACKTIAPSYVDTAKLYFEIFVNQAEKELAEERKDD